MDDNDKKNNKEISYEVYMILTKKDLKKYLFYDYNSLFETNKLKNHFDIRWKIQKQLRKTEYIYNSKFYPRVYKLYKKYRFKKKCEKYLLYIPLNVIDYGFAIVHFGNIIINPNSKIGINFRVQSGVVIGATNGKKEAPILGDNIYIGSGAKIIGNINICSNVAIGANAVVVKDIIEAGTYGGVPVRKISDNDSSVHIKKQLIKR